MFVCVCDSYLITGIFVNMHVSTCLCTFVGASSVFVILYVCFLLLQPAAVLICPCPTSHCLFTVPGLIYGLLLLFFSDIVEYCRLWLPLQTPCHSVPCTVTAGPPWGPYIHSNWFGKDLAAFELKRDGEESGEWGREMERKRGEVETVLVLMACIFLAVSLSSFHIPFLKKTTMQQ